MQIGAMNHPARNPLEEIDWFGRQGFDFVDFTLEPPAADPAQIDPKAIRAALDRRGLGVVTGTPAALVNRESSLANKSPEAYGQLAFFQVSALPLPWKMRTGCPNKPVEISRSRRFASWLGTTSTFAARSPAPLSNAP